MPFPKHAITLLLTALAVCLFSPLNPAKAQEILVKEIAFNDQNQLEISLSQKSSFKIFTLKNPPRLVVDILNAKLEERDYKPSLPDFVSSFYDKKNTGYLRLVFELQQKISIQKSGFEKSGNNKIIVSLNGVGTTKTAAPSSDFINEKITEFEVETTKIANADGSTKYVVKKIPKQSAVLAEKKPRLPIIVIDSGHGGKDPGTIGLFARTKEKNLTLSYAKELGKQLINSKRYKVFLTRDEDNFIPLKQRVAIARKKKADLFISLHANASADNSVNGFSIYTLSEKSSDRQAALLAEKENRADIISGMDFEGASADIMKTLIDLSQRQTKNGSASFANLAIKSIRDSEINILQNSHRFAGFAVLTAPDMISVLIELGYLSNKQEEKLLNSIGYKRKVAEGLVKAIDEYFSKNKSE